MTVCFKLQAYIFFKSAIKRLKYIFVKFENIAQFERKYNEVSDNFMHDIFKYMIT